MAAGHRHAVLLLFLAALILYAPGIQWGLPHATAAERVFAWGSDEVAPLGPLAQLRVMVFHGVAGFDPRYPLLDYVIQAAFMAPYLGLLLLTDGLGTISPEYPFGLKDPVSALATMTLLARISSLLMVAAVPAIAYSTARTLWNARTAVIVGLFTLVLYPLVYYSRTSNVDGSALFFTSLGFLHYAACLRHGISPRRLALFGLFAALATAAKDQSYALFVTAIAVLASRQVMSASIRAAVPMRQTLIAFGAMLAAALPTYLVASGAVFNPAYFLRHVNFILHGSQTGNFFYGSTPATPAGYVQLLFTFGGHLVDSMGAPMMAAALAGCILAARTDRVALLFAAPVLGLLLGVIVPVRFVLFRFVMPAAYLLAFFAGFLITEVADRLAEGRTVSPGRSLWPRRLAHAAVLIIAGWGLVRAADLTYQMRNDPRTDLAEWLRRNARPGDRLGYYGSPSKLPALEPWMQTVAGPHDTGGEALVTDPPEFLVLLPQQPFENEHEWTLPAEHYRDLRAGAWDYEPVLMIQASTLFDRRPVSWVNPPVRLFVRRDVIPRLADIEPRLELD